MPRPHLSLEQQDHAWTQWRTGRSVRSVAHDLGVPVQHVRRHFAATGGVRNRPVGRSTRHLSMAEREEISRGVAAGYSLRAIATGLGRAHCTISREVARNGGRGAHRAVEADTGAYARAKRPKTSKLTRDLALRAAVEHGLAEEWSPRQISRRLRLDHPDDHAMRVSHEAIYLSLFVPHHSPLPRRLTQQLRTGRAMRYPKVARQPTGRGRLRDMRDCCTSRRHLVPGVIGRGSTAGQVGAEGDDVLERWLALQQSVGS